MEFKDGGFMEIGQEVEISISDFFDLSQEGGTYEVWTPQGWKELGTLVKKNKKDCYILRSDSHDLGGSDDHLVMTNRGWLSLKEVDIEKDTVETSRGQEALIAKEYVGEKNTFDFEVKSEEHAYYANGIVSHNTGKTTLGFIVCNMAEDFNVIWVTADSLMENERQRVSIKSFYKLADFLSPCIFILEDLDIIGEDRELRNNMGLGVLMNILDGINSIKNCVTLSTTNRLEVIERALCEKRPGRFDRKIEIPSLSADLRKKMFKDRLPDYEISPETIAYFVKRTDDWTGAQVQEVINTLHFEFVNSGYVEKKVTTKQLEDAIAKLQDNDMTGDNPKMGY